MSDNVTQTLNLVSNDPVEIGGHTFDNLSDLLAAHSDDIHELISNYGTLGNYLESIGFTNTADITPEQLQASYDLIDKVINQGIDPSDNSSSAANSTTTSSSTKSILAANTTASSASPSASSGLALVGRRGMSHATKACAGSAAITAGGAVGTAAVCANCWCCVSGCRAVHDGGGWFDRSIVHNGIHGINSG